MALEFFDGIKKFDLNKTIDSISNIASSVLGTSEEEAKETPKTIDSIDSLEDYLQGLQEGASPAILMALQSQLHLFSQVY